MPLEYAIQRQDLCPKKPKVKRYSRVSNPVKRKCMAFVLKIVGFMEQVIFFKIFSRREESVLGVLLVKPF